MTLPPPRPASSAVSASTWIARATCQDRREGPQTMRDARRARNSVQGRRRPGGAGASGGSIQRRPLFCVCPSNVSTTIQHSVRAARQPPTPSNLVQNNRRFCGCPMLTDHRQGAKSTARSQPAPRWWALSRAPDAAPASFRLRPLTAAGRVRHAKEMRLVDAHAACIRCRQTTEQHAAEQPLCILGPEDDLNCIGKLQSHWLLCREHNKTITQHVSCGS